jgi:predicted Zn finger-like uncharacterized protein
MQIACPNCATTYDVPEAALGAEGRSVRCARCKNTWLARKPEFAMASDVDDGFAAFPDDPPPEAPDAPPTAAEPEFDEWGLPVGQSDEPEAGAEDDDAMATAMAAEAGGPPGLLKVRKPPPLVPDGGPELPEDVVSDAADYYRLKRAALQQAAAEGIESLAAVRSRREASRVRLRWPLSIIGTVILVLALIAGGLLMWRAAIVRLLPQTASFYSGVGLGVNLRGLAFENIKISRAQHDNVSVLIIEGIIVSKASKPVEVPRLRFAIRNEQGQEVYTWTALPARAMLPPGESLPFRSRLSSPPPDTSAVLVRFFHRRDIVTAGTQ